MEIRDEIGSGTAVGSETARRRSVLIPTGKKMKSYGCMRSLGRRGIRTIVASEYENTPHFASRFCSERARLSSSPRDLLAYKDDLLEIARRSDVETILPIRECDTYLFAKYRDEFEDAVSLFTPTLSTLKKGHDRLQLATEAEKAGVPVANTRLLSDVDEWNADAVVKSRYNILTSEYVDSYSPRVSEEVKDVRFLQAGDEPDTETIREEMKHEPIVQEFVPQADKHLYCALWDHGEPLATYQHRQIRQNSWMGGGGIYRESVHSEEVEQVAYELLDQLDWHGFACIEYVKDKRTGEWKFLEINPRVWQSMPEAVRADADFPYYYWLGIQGKQDSIDDSYESGIACHNAYGEIGHLRSILHDESPYLERPSFAETAWNIATSCVRNPRFDYIRLDDHELFLSALREAFSSGVTSSREYDRSDPQVHARPQAKDSR